eukprot:6652758-Alexandrium_andersonii.AAC.1
MAALPHHLEQLPLPGEAVTIWARIEDCQMFSHAARMPAVALLQSLTRPETVSYTHLRAHETSAHL